MSLSSVVSVKTFLTKINFKNQDVLIATITASHGSREWSRIHHRSNRRRRRARIENTNGFPAVIGHDDCWLEEGIRGCNDLTEHTATAIAK